MAPMLLMVLHKDLVTTLVTASVSTLLFALATTTWTKEDPATLVGATAAYAAVIVVFVGSSS